MGNFYSRHVFPWLVECFLGRKKIGELRHELLRNVSGDVLEIGFGTGLNLPHYPPDVRKLVVIDTNPGMHRLAQKRIRSSRLMPEECILSGEHLPFGDATFDHAVTTFTLCSIGKVSQALQEIRRVLRPHGKIHFLEHGLSPEPKIARWQGRLNFIQRRIGDGCHLDRDMAVLLETASFRMIECKKFYCEKMPKLAGFFYMGAAERF